MATLRKRFGKHLPIIALCAGNAETVIATEADATDIVRRPYDWDVITRRVVRAVNAHRAILDLQNAQENLERADAAARVARRDHARSATIDKLTRLPNGDRAPLFTVASVEESRAYSSIRRVDGRRVVTVSADVDEALSTPNVANTSIVESIMPELEQSHPGLRWVSAGISRIKACSSVSVRMKSI